MTLEEAKLWLVENSRLIGAKYVEGEIIATRLVNLYKAYEESSDGILPDVLIGAVERYKTYIEEVEIAKRSLKEISEALTGKS